MRHFVLYSSIFRCWAHDPRAGRELKRSMRMGASAMQVESAELSTRLSGKVDAGVRQLSYALGDMAGALEFDLASRKSVSPPLEMVHKQASTLQFHTENAVIFLVALVTLISLTLTAMHGRFNAFELMLILGYMAFSLAVDLTIIIIGQQGGQSAGGQLALILIVEMVKFVFSFSWSVVERNGVFDQIYQLKLMSWQNVAWMNLSAVCYAANNFLLLFVLQRVDPQVYAVFKESNLVAVAFFWVFLFKAELGPMRWLGIGTILCACVFPGARQLVVEQFDPTVLLIFVMSLANGLGAVSNEKALKEQSATTIDLNLQNTLLYGMGIVFVSATGTILKGASFLGSDLFDELGKLACLTIAFQCALGLLGSRLVRYTCSPTKAVLVFVRPFSLVFAAPMLLGTRHSWVSVGAAAFAAAGALIYLRQGPLDMSYRNLSAEKEKTAEDLGHGTVVAAGYIMMALGCIFEVVFRCLYPHHWPVL